MTITFPGRYAKFLTALAAALGVLAVPNSPAKPPAPAVLPPPTGGQI